LQFSISSKDSGKLLKCVIIAHEQHSNTIPFVQTVVEASSLPKKEVRINNNALKLNRDQLRG
jgi:hypothetical protein